MSKEQVLELIQERLQYQHPGGVNLAVVAQGIRHENNTWYVPVLPSAQPSSTFEYYDALADVETQLSLDEQLNVWLIPAVAGEAP